MASESRNRSWKVPSDVYSGFLKKSSRVLVNLITQVIDYLLDAALNDLYCTFQARTCVTIKNSVRPYSVSTCLEESILLSVQTETVSAVSN